MSAQKLEYHGSGGTLLGIGIVNLLLTVLTLGIYSFWARTRLRRYFYSETELAGDRFVYHGTAMELLRGWLRAIGVLILVGIVFSGLFAVTAPSSPDAQPSRTQALVMLGLMLLYFGTLVALVAIAVNGARRYRLSRSSWRGIRFSFRGRWQDYLRLVIRGSVLSALTLSLYSPFFRNQSRAFLVEHAYFGSLQFGYDGDGKELFRQYLLALLLAIPTLGLYLVWFNAFQQRYFWSHTTVGDARFLSTVTVGSLLGLALTNMLLAVVTLGVGIPWVITRTMRYVCDRLTLAGEIDWKNVQQQAMAASVTGEGLAEGLDVDVDIGIGM
ncbi:MAG: DUF898 domain-containing protein [Gemmatimonadetes bacterium]|nr:DUF898 domain-containing protein [Gemmatimonadota bacterium]